MPIKVYRNKPGAPVEEVAWLCDDSWSLPLQVSTFSAWLDSSAKELKPGALVADIGFGWRTDAGGGGSALEPKALARMAELDMTLLLSEYPVETNDA